MHLIGIPFPFKAEHSQAGILWGPDEPLRRTNTQKQRIYQRSLVEKANTWNMVAVINKSHLS